MILAACVLLSLPGTLAEDPFDDVPPVLQETWELGDWGVDPFVQVRIGGWRAGGFDFEVVRTTGTSELKGRGVVLAGIDIGAVLAERVLVSVTAEYADGDDMKLTVGGVSVGWRAPAELFGIDGSPDRFSVYAGAIFGAIDIDVEGFGRVGDNWGFRAGLELGWTLSDLFVLNLFIELRVIEFEYRGANVIGGDKEIGGGGAALGFNLQVNF